MAKQNKAIFRVQFRHRDQLVELYAHGVNQSSLMGFIEVSGMIFDNKTEVLIDPSEEKIKAEFGGVKSTYLPIQSIVRIDEVEKTGISKIHPLRDTEKHAGSITPFPYSSPNS